MDHVLLDGTQLSIEQVMAVAYGEPGAPAVRLTEAAATRVTRAAQAVQQLIDEGVVAYGITTGFGAFKDRIIPPDQVATAPAQHRHEPCRGRRRPLRQRHDARDHAHPRQHAGARPLRHPPGDAGSCCWRMLNRGVHPVIPRKGSLGASGDLAPLAHMALVLIGLGEAEVNGDAAARRARRWRRPGSRR